jgi:hypothetical protein
LKFQTCFKSSVAKKYFHGEIALLSFMRRGIKEISSVKARHVKARHGLSRQGMARLEMACQGKAWHAKARQGMSCQVRHGKAWHVKARQG